MQRDRYVELTKGRERLPKLAGGLPTASNRIEDQINVHRQQAVIGGCGLTGVANQASR